jgi:hypothetical protein
LRKKTCLFFELFEKWKRFFDSYSEYIQNINITIYLQGFMSSLHVRPPDRKAGKNEE